METNTIKWHRRLGHISFNKMKLIKEINCEVSNAKCECIVCIKGKQTRKPFGGKGRKAEESLQLIHSDVVGPMLVESLSGYKYFVTFIDDYSRKLFTFPMKMKSEVFDLFVKFKTLAENQTEKKLKIIRSDNDGEYVNNKFDNFCKENGIIHQLTVPYTPQLNGVAERMNRTIIERIRCMLIDANLHKNFWAEALNTATFILNLIPRDGKDSPNKLWNNEIHNLESLRVFGCKAMVHVPDEKRKKLDNKSIECIFLGYENNMKGYRFYDVKKEKVIISRDVIFLEDEKLTNIEHENVFIVNNTENDFSEKSENINHPSTYQEAITCKESFKWKEAMDNEYQS